MERAHGKLASGSAPGKFDGRREPAAGFSGERLKHVDYLVQERLCGPSTSRGVPRDWGLQKPAMVARHIGASLLEMLSFTGWRNRCWKRW